MLAGFELDSEVVGMTVIGATVLDIPDADGGAETLGAEDAPGFRPEPLDESAVIAQTFPAPRQEQEVPGATACQVI